MMGRTTSEVQYQIAKLERRVERLEAKQETPEPTPCRKAFTEWGGGVEADWLPFQYGFNAACIQMKERLKERLRERVPAGMPTGTFYALMDEVYCAIADPKTPGLDPED